MKEVKKVTKSQQKLAQSYRDAGFKTAYHINGIHIYLITDQGLELKTKRLKKSK